MTLRLRLFNDPSATVPLRFDDPAFLAALEADDAKKPEGDRQGPLAKVLGVLRATDYDFTPFAADGWTIHARTAITGGEEDAILESSQRASGVPDLTAVNQNWWATWTKRVTLPDGAEDDLSPKERAALAALSSPNRKARGEAFGVLPTMIRDAFRARLRAHIDDVARPAERDPDKTSPKVQAGQHPPDIGSSYDGGRDLS